ncbi:MAG TPA: glycoside hydrolase family 38 C-terminal domain-containing protein, partial [Gaiellales bacterium]|nr:glycoside hydrolase family 38 C-terminal domain-containing protein [Gaiellales bacterium]
GNARGERALHDAEFLAAAAMREAGADYPSERLDELWKLLLLNQFHDILPGSSIGLVYEDAARDHAVVLAGAEALAVGALAAIAGGGPSAPVNTMGAARAEVAERPDGELAWVEAPSYGIGTAAEAAPDVARATERGDRVVLENGLLRAELARDGRLASLVHLASDREALEQPGNVLQLYDDRPTAHEAWDVDPFHLETVRDAGPAESCAVTQPGGLRAQVELRYRIGSASTLHQLVRLDAGASRLEFHCEVDWRERRTMLKVLFPVAVHSPSATYQMQFGHAERPTHFSTSHDLARYEVPGHRFADLSEHGFGVALLTDCKYGYSTLGGEMRISLLRSTSVPDPDADAGNHAFAYAVLPHPGGWREAGVVAEAARFATPLRWASVAGEPRSWLSVDDPNLVLDTVKRAEDSDALLLRLYEAHGARGRARLRVGWPVTEAVSCNLLEDAGEALPLDGGVIELGYRPHQIISLLVS